MITVVIGKIIHGVVVLERSQEVGGEMMMGFSICCCNRWVVILQILRYVVSWVMLFCFLNDCCAYAGDYEGAIDTLRMAITLIKQSVTASSEASQVHVQVHVHDIHVQSVQEYSTCIHVYIYILYHIPIVDAFSPDLCQIMIQSLQDCLQGMEQQASMGK